MRFLSPDMRADRVWDIDLPALTDRGKTALIIDIDNTIVEWGGWVIPKEARDWIDRARALGFSMCLLTNNRRPRASHFGRELGLPVVWGWAKPWAWGFRRALHTIGAHPESVVVVGDQVFTDVLGARCAGLEVILVSPFTRKEFFLTRLLRRLERLASGERR
ncbi:MAG: YqeG family HAD IIIA-type phosphatase [Firmicutes bacterium]|jgi:HAD superfamily phosphatase (TIGR01668 family)|nr:YqeG family HAD IIIA-type phosphatase [Bacillota bacterium]